MDDREVIARALRTHTYGSLPAKIMADAVLAALKASGRVIVPVEPTEAMAKAVEEVTLWGAGDWNGDARVFEHDASRVWATMIAAAKEPTE